MSTLERRNYVGQANQERLGYVLSEKLLGLATPVVGDASFIENAIPHMRALRDLTRESMLAGVMLENEGVVLEQVEGLHNFSFKVNPGLRFPYIRRPLAKLFWLTWEKRREEVINSLVLKKFTSKNDNFSKQLLEEVEEVAQLGYGVDREEEMEGQVCVGSAVLNRSAELAGAIWLVAPASRLPESEIPRSGVLVKETADKISTSLGCVFFELHELL